MTTVDMLSIVVGLLAGVLLTLAFLIGLVAALVVVVTRHAGDQMRSQAAQDFARQAAAASRVARSPAPGPEA